MVEKSGLRWALLVWVLMLNPSAFAQDWAYRLMGVDGLTVVRVVTTDAQCPSIEVEGQPMALELRVSESRAGSEHGSAASFPVQVCERDSLAADRRVVFKGAPLPGLPHSPQRIVVLGDTGCRLKWPGFYQSCNDPERWPFARVALSAAAEHPDLVIHVGDYLYRESPCPTQGCEGTPVGYGWEGWRADFFDPAEPLLAASPWVFVRGNHESCLRAGQGWFRFLEPGRFTPGRVCDGATGSVNSLDSPYGVPLGEGLQLIVMDSTSASEKNPRPGNPWVDVYRRQFDEVARLAGAYPENWLTLHHPILGFGYFPLLGFQKSNPVLTTALGQSKNARLDESFDLVLQGHIHTFELNRFASREPLSLIAGMGGDMLEPPFPDLIPDHFEPAPGALLKESVTDQSFGYVVLDRLADGQWRLTEKTPLGTVRRVCNLSLKSSGQGNFACPADTPPPETLAPAAAGADYVLLGEVHDNPAAHALRFSWLKSLGKNQSLGLAFEQFDHGRLDIPVSPAEDQRRVDDQTLKNLAQQAGFDFKGWNWAFYEPVLAWGIVNGWRIEGANLDHQTVRAIVMGRSPSPVALGGWGIRQQKVQEQAIREGHCGLLPEDQVPSMVKGQVAKDREMALSLLELHRKTGLPVILLAGNGHVRKDVGVPFWLHSLDPQARVFSLGVLETGKDGVPVGVFDQTVRVPAQERPDPCQALRKRLNGSLHRAREAP